MDSGGPELREDPRIPAAALPADLRTALALFTPSFTSTLMPVVNLVPRPRGPLKAGEKMSYTLVDRVFQVVRSVFKGVLDSA